MIGKREMKIAGLEKLSFVDYPGMLAAVFFTTGCNFRCYYCHNSRLIPREGPAAMTVDDALEWLDSRNGFLDAVVISGGEPTLDPGLAPFIRRVRERGYLVKLDTNGYRPQVLETLLDEGLVDYVAMDVKAPREKYGGTCGVTLDTSRIDRSIKTIMAAGVDYEFRTTVVPQLDENDVLSIARWLRGARRYVLQQFRRPDENNDFVDLRNAAHPHPENWPDRILPEIESLVENCLLRGFDSRSAVQAKRPAADKDDIQLTG